MGIHTLNFQVSAILCSETLWKGEFYLILDMPGIFYPTSFRWLMKSSTGRTYSDKGITFTSGFRVQTCLSKERRVSSLLQSGDSSPVWAGEGDIKFSGQQAWWNLQTLKDCLTSVQMPSLTIINIKLCPLSQAMMLWNTVPFPPLEFKPQKARNTNN